MVSAGRHGLVLVGLVVLACSTPTDTCACTRALPAVAVQGSAVDTDGTELSGVAVSALVYDASCTLPGEASDRVVSDATGAFQLYLTLGGDPREICAEITGVRHHASGDDTVTVARLRGRTGVPPEVLTVTLVFPARNAGS